MKKNYFKSSSGSLVLALIVTVIAIIFHIDFWNWGKHNFYFGWVPQEFLYRAIFIGVVIPLINYLIQKISWPVPEEYEKNREGKKR